MISHISTKDGCSFGNSNLGQWFSEREPQTTRVQGSSKQSAKSNYFEDARRCLSFFTVLTFIGW